MYVIFCWIIPNSTYFKHPFYSVQSDLHRSDEPHQSAQQQPDQSGRLLWPLQWQPPEKLLHVSWWENSHHEPVRFLQGWIWGRWEETVVWNTEWRCVGFGHVLFSLWTMSLGVILFQGLRASLSTSNAFLLPNRSAKRFIFPFVWRTLGRITTTPLRKALYPLGNP